MQASANNSTIIEAATMLAANKYATQEETGKGFAFNRTSTYNRENMRMRIFLTACIILLSLGMSTQSTAQYFPGRGGWGYNRGYGYGFGGPRVVIAVRPPVRPFAYRYAPRPYVRPYAYRYRRYDNGNYNRGGRYNDRGADRRYENRDYNDNGRYERNDDDLDYDQRYEQPQDRRDDSRNFDGNNVNDDVYDNGTGNEQYDREYPDTNNY